MKIAGFEVDLEVFRKYAGQALPRHVAYPMPTWWDDLTEAQAVALLHESRQCADPRDLSLYVHVPFCERVCRYCACHRVAQPRNTSRAQERTEAYVSALKAELSSLRRLKIPGIVLLDSKKYKHFVVIKGIKKDQVYLGDPASGNRSMSTKTFDEAWNGVVFLVVSNDRMRGVSKFTLESALPAPTMSVMRVQGLAGGTLSFCRMHGEF